MILVGSEVTSNRIVKGLKCGHRMVSNVHVLSRITPSRSKPWITGFFSFPRLNSFKPLYFGSYLEKDYSEPIGPG